MRLKFLGGAALVAALGVAMLPASALPVAQISENVAETADFDSRSGAVAPTSAQRSHARRIKAKVRWGQFGTPASVLRYGKFLARGVRGKTAAAAASWYLNRHKALFGLSSLDGLRVESMNRLVGSKGYVVNFRQVFGNLETSESGLVTVGVTGSKNRWKVAYISSSLTRDRALAGTAKLSAAGAWTAAARNAGLTKTIANVLSRKKTRGWTQLGVAGVQGNQLVKLVAFPTVRRGVVPAYETVVVDLKTPLALRTFVDAATGRILARSNLVDHAAQGKIKLAAGESFTFNGTLPAADASCNTHGPFAVGTGNRALDGFAAATVPTNDLVLELWLNGVRLVQADTLFSPEQFHYEPAGGILAGNYEIKVCDFPGGGGWAAPTTYTGTLNADASPPPPPYLAKWKVFPNVPGLYTLNQDPWNIPDLDTRETWCWIEALGCDRLAGGALTSRGSWDHDHKLNAPTFTTRGNNAKSATSWTHDLLPSPPQHMPTSPVRDYSYPWTNSWENDDCEPTPNGPAGATWDDSAATVNLFMAHNRMHDWSYHLGFTERNWNAQDYNFGLTERRQENDPILGDVQAGALIPGVRDNANMITFADGVPSVTNMYFWQPIAGAFYAPCVDGDYDMGVIGHEYGHMIENRMIGKGNTRSGHHAGAMGESHGDLFGMEYVNSNGFTPTSDENRYAVGVYDTGNKQRAIRNYGMNFPTSGGVPEPGKQLMIDALNFSDMGYDVTGPQVHADGEIWSKTNFAIRQLLIDKYDDDYPAGDQELQTECAEGYVPAHRCPGNRRWIQLVFDAMLLMPTNPTMLQARDAALTADLMRFGGANQKELWLGYARQGMGVNAASSNTTADTDIDPTPDFEPVGTRPATVNFEVENSDRDDVSARIYVGHYQARVSPIADTNPATSGLNLDDTAKFAPGTYELIAHAPGYGFHRFRETFRSGRTHNIEIELPTNWASMTSGATASTTDGAATVNNLIDDTEGTSWNAPATNVLGAISVDGKTATIDLGGTNPVRVRYIQVSAMLSAGNNRFSALRSFEIWACNNKGAGDCTTNAGFSKVYSSPDNAFPGDPPRPVAPHLILRKFNVPDFSATHLRFVVKTSQCTGTPAFQGDQDADPANNADCDTNVAVTNTRNLVRSAELQVFRSNVDVD